jgi:phosphohistidine phosphatase SixA
MADETKTITLKHVVAVRHGEDGGKHLSEKGKEQVTKLVDKLSTLITGQQHVLVLSSHATRAEESAQIIEAKFGVKHLVSETFYLDYHHHGEEQMKAILAMADGADTVIVVTHYEAPSGIANAFMKSRFNKSVAAKICGKGNGFMISLENGEVISDILAFNPVSSQNHATV